MSYPKKAGHLAFMVPNIPLATTTAGVLREIDIGAASSDHGEFVCIYPVWVLQTQFTVTGEVVAGTTTAPTVIFTKRPTPLSATGESVISTLTIPDGTAVGATIFEDISDDILTLEVGDSIEVSWTVGVGSPTGMGHASMICAPDPEYSGNNTGLTATA